jgi:flagellar protein FliS
MNYQQQAMVGATGVELVIGLYDAAMRHLYRAQQSVAEDDVHARRQAVSKVIDILTYLQARLQADVGGSVAQTLSDFYAVMLTMTLEASYRACAEDFVEVIACLRNVREAWTIVAKDPEAGKVLSQEHRTAEEKFVGTIPLQVAPAAVPATRWLA